MLCGLACAGLSPSEPEVAPEPESDTPTPRFDARIGSGSSRTEAIEIIDADLAKGVLALRIVYVYESMERLELTCQYPGLDKDEGVRLYLVQLGEEAEIEKWTVYASPDNSREACTTEIEARAELAKAKARMKLAGLDPSERTPLIPPAGDPGADPRDVRRPTELSRIVPLGDGHKIDVRMTHDSDAGYHTYRAEVSVDGGAPLVHEHSPNPAQGGAGDLEIRGALRQGDRAVLLLEESWGPAAMWDDWVISPVLEL